MMLCDNENADERMNNAERLIRLTDEKINVVEAVDLLKNVETFINNKQFSKPAENDACVNNEKEKKQEIEDGFYSRLKNLYNKPLKAEKTMNTSSGPFSDQKSKEIFRNINPPKKNKNFNYLPNKRRINLKAFLNDELICKSLGEDMELEKIIDRQRVINLEDDVESCRSTVPSLADLPDDEKELEKLVKSYIADIKPSWKRHKSGKPFRPGTKESVRNIDYRLADLPSGEDHEKAVTGGALICACPEEIVIDGEIDTMKDIDLKLEELKKNHKASRITIKIGKVQSVKDSIDNKDKAQKYQGPFLMTRYCLERVCETVAAHPKLSMLTIEKVPLSQPYQAILVPSFATLRELKLISNRLGDDGVKTICRYAWRSGSLRVLDLTDNKIGPSGVSQITTLIERRAVLRMLEPEFFGVERITVNRNPIRYDGFKELLNSAGKDLWIKALDIRDCELTIGGEDALKLVTNNRQIEVLDLRGNSVKCIGDVIRTVLKNCPPEKAEYKWHDKEDLEKYWI